MLAPRPQQQDNRTAEKAKQRVSQLVESVLPQQKTREDLMTKCDNDARYVRKKGNKI